MGPPSCDGGDTGPAACGPRSAGPSFNGAAVLRRRRPRATTTTRRSRCSFNRAAVLRRRRRYGGNPEKMIYFTLQWGRRPATAETSQRVQRGQLEPRASMGPPSCDGGDWSLRSRAACPCPCFNGAAVLRRRRPPPRQRRNALSSVASMGPPSCDGGDTKRPEEVTDE